jgi:glycosyltransferase involved in cell wall biosynthesis
MSEARVSVVIAVHNGERYLADAIQSVLRQRPAVKELIVVDDSSLDSSLDIARRFGPPVRCIPRQRGGVAAARNAGVAASSGDYIAFLDADDFWTTTALAVWLRAFADDPELGLVFGQVREFISPDLDKQASARLVCRQGLKPAHLAGGALVHRRVFEQVGKFREDLVTGEFIDWIARVRERRVREVLLDDHVLWRRLHGSNFSLARRDARTEYARVLKWALDRRRADYAQKRSR